MAAKEAVSLPAVKTPKKPHHFRLSQETLDKIDEMAAVHGHSRTAIVEHAVSWMHTEWKNEQKKRK